MSDLVTTNINYVHSNSMPKAENSTLSEPSQKSGIKASSIQIKSDNYISANKKQSEVVPKEVNFLDTEKMVCIDPNGIIDNKKEHVSETLFTSTIENSKVLGDLDIEITSKQGFANLNNSIIEGKIKNGSIAINHDVFDKALFAVKGLKIQDSSRTTEVKSVNFDKKENSYNFDVKVTQNVPKLGFPAFWDNFQIKLKVGENGQLMAKVDKNWLPDSIVIDKLEGVVRNKIKAGIPEQYRNLNIELQKKGDSIILVPQVKDLEIPLASKGSVKVHSVDGEKAKFKLDSDGNLHIDLKDITVSGGVKASGNSIKADNNLKDTAGIQLKFGLGKDDKKQVYAKGALAINLDEKTTQGIKLGNESLGNYFSSGKVLNDFSIFAESSPNTKPTVLNKNYVYIEDAKLGNQKANLESALQLSFDPTNGIQLDNIEKTDSNIDIKPTQNGIQFFVNGTQYFPEMQKMISSAKESIALETYQLHNDASGNKVAYMLAKKAAGLETDDGVVKLSKTANKGVDIKLIFNSWQGSLAGGKESEEMVKKNIEKVKEEINNSKLSTSQKQAALDNLDKNFKWKFFSDGLLRSDHRKVFVVDGNQATVGGMNMGSQYLSADAYHDVMLRIAGPEVRNVHKEFLENWFEFNGLPQPSTNDFNKMLKTPVELERKLLELNSKGELKSSAKVATLVTDDKQTDIKKGILKLISSAKNEINIEQAFFSDTEINSKLAEAMKNGVNINVVVAKSSVIGMFDAANLYSVNELLKVKKQGALGNIKLFYYDSTGNETKHIHTKAISVDGDKAIIGSANMIGRSLNSPFKKIEPDGSKDQTLYNKELSLYVEGKDMVSEINSRLFEEDMVNNSKEVSPQEIESLVQKFGGESELRKKAIMAKVT